MIHINSSPEAPPPRIRILDARAREVETVRIGDRLTFRIEIPEDSECSSNKYVDCPMELISVFHYSSIWYLCPFMCCHGERLKEHIPNYRR